MLRLLLLSFAARAAVAADPANSTLATVYKSPAGNWSVKFGVRDSAAGAAWGSWRDGNATASNFGSLSLQSHPDQPDQDQLYAIGFLEGALTAGRIHDEVVNLREVLLMHYGGLPSTDPKDFPELLQWFANNDVWCRAQVAANPNVPFFRALGLVLRQFDGLLAGYSASPVGGSLPLTVWDFQMLNGVGDLFDLVPAVYPKLRKDFSALSKDQITSCVQSTRALKCLCACVLMCSSQECSSPSLAHSLARFLSLSLARSRSLNVRVCARV